MIATPPHILLLGAIKETLDAVDYVDDAGVAGVTVRHRRNRHSTVTELPCQSIMFVDDDNPDDAALDLNAWEQGRMLTVDLVSDLELDPEDAGADPTGNLKLSLMAAASVKALKTPGSPIALLTDHISQRSIAPSDDSKPDKGRLVTSLIVLYRVRTDDPNILLAEGVNA